MDEGVTITWRDLYVHARIKRNGKTRYKRIINGGNGVNTVLQKQLDAICGFIFAVNGAVKAGSLVALMGAR